MTSTDKLERPAWGVWVDYKIAPPGSYACLVSRFMDNRWTDPEPQWMPAQLRPQLHGEVRVMPYLMPNDPLAAVNAMPELVAKVKRLEEALKPFADEADKWANCIDKDAQEILIAHPIDVTVDSYGEIDGLNDAAFTLGDLRRARAALKETGQ